MPTAFISFKGGASVAAEGGSLTDVTGEVFETAIRLTRSAVTVPESGNQDSYDIGGSAKREWVVNFATSNDDGDLPVMLPIMWTQAEANGLVDVKTKFFPGAPSAQNQVASFTIAPLEVTRGGTTGQFGQQSATYPIVGPVTWSATY